MYRKFLSVVIVIGLSSMICTSPAYTKEPKRKLEIPHCSRSLGTISVVEPETKWWEKYGLGSPEAVLKFYISESGCFGVADRGRGMQSAERERALAAAGVLRPRANIGKGQVKAADYVLTPDLLSSNSSSGGNAIGGIVGTFVGGPFGAIASGLTFNSKTADVTLSLINVRSAEADIIVRGSAKNTDMGGGAGGGAVGSSGVGALAAGGYTDTEVGKVIMTAYLDAYIRLVDKLGGLSQDPVHTAPTQAYETVSAANMREGPSVRERSVRVLPAHTQLYPTGNEAQGWVEVEDDMQFKGWVNKQLLQLAK